MLQLTYLGYTCGEAVSPVITRLFLLPFNYNHFNSTSNSHSSAVEFKDIISTTRPSLKLSMFTDNDAQFEDHWHQNGSSEFHTIAKLSNDVALNFSEQVGVELSKNIELVRFAYATVIPVYVIVALWFVFIVYCDKQAKTTAVKLKSDSNVNESRESKSLKILLLTVMVLFYLAAFMEEATILTLITPIAITSWGWAVKAAALTSSVIMIGYLIGRLLCMFVSAFIDPIIMLAVAIALILFGTIELLISQYSTTTNTFVILSSLVIFGLGQSTLSAVKLFLIGKYVTITPTVSSLYLISTSVGWILASYCSSRIYETYGHLAVFWILLVLAVSVMLLFVVEVIIGKLISKDKQTVSTLPLTTMI